MKKVLVLLVCALSLGCNPKIDQSETLDCKILLRDPQVLQHVNVMNFWDEGIIDAEELYEMKLYQREIRLKERHNR